MSSPIEGGEGTIKKVFHPLITRLIKINTGLLEQGPQFYVYDSFKNYVELISEIEDIVHIFPATKAIESIQSSLQLIDQIVETKKNLVVDNQPKDLWLNYSDLIEKSNREITYYESHLEQIKEVLLMILENENIIPSFKKIKINITIEKLAGIIYFLNEDKIFNTNLMQLCRGVGVILCQDNGEDIKINNLYNEVFEFKKDGTLVNFWKEKFESYIQQSETIPKKKRKL